MSLAMDFLYGEGSAHEIGLTWLARGAIAASDDGGEVTIAAQEVAKIDDAHGLNFFSGFHGEARGRAAMRRWGGGRGSAHECLSEFQMMHDDGGGRSDVIERRGVQFEYKLETDAQRPICLHVAKVADHASAAYVASRFTRVA